MEAKDLLVDLVCLDNLDQRVREVLLAQLVPQERPVNVDHQVKLDDQESQDNKVLVDSLAQQAFREVTGVLDRLDNRVCGVPWVKQDHKAKLANKEQKDSKGPQVPVVLKDNGVHLDNQAHRDNKARLVHLGNKGDRVRQDLKEKEETQEPVGSKVCLAVQVLQDRTGTKANKARLDVQGQQALWVQLVQLADLDHRVSRVNEDPRGLMDSRRSEVLLDLLDHKVNVAHQAQLVNKDSRVKLDFQVKQDQVAQLVSAAKEDL